MKPDAEQEKALREKIKRQTSENIKPELRPVENYSIYEELKSASRQKGRSSSLNSFLKPAYIIAGLIVLGLLAYFLY